MDVAGAERRRPTPVQTPEERDVWKDGGRAEWRDVGREGWRDGRESGVVQSYSFDSYQLEEEEISKDVPERGVLALSEPGTAGVIISLSRIFTKLLIQDERRNTVIFFLISIGMEMLCFLLHLLVRRSRFIRYYTSHGQGKGPGKGHDPHGNSTGYRVHHDVTFPLECPLAPPLVEFSGRLLPIHRKPRNVHIDPKRAGDLMEMLAEGGQSVRVDDHIN